MDELRIIIAGGGTGGHLFPAIAVAEEFTKMVPNAKISFVGTASGLEAKIIPHTMWDLVQINDLAFKFKGAKLFNKLKTLVMMPVIFVQALIILQKKKPNLVISVGGYAAGPLTLVAAVFGIPTVAMEQNAIPGFTNRILGRFVKKIFLTFDESAKYFAKKKVVISGNPVRLKIKETIDNPVRKKEFKILIFGGSQGAKVINEKMIEALDHLLEMKDEIRIIHQIGKLGDTERFLAAYRARGFAAEVHHFIEDMGKAYANSDLVICRAGATSIAELTVIGKPAILIPYPFAADNHQVANAKTLEKTGGAIMILNSDLTGELLARHISKLFDEPLRLEAMGAAMKRWGKPDAASVIVRECMKLVISV